MNLIHKRATRCANVYPQDRFILAHKALSGDREADAAWVFAVAKRRRSLWYWLKKWVLE